MLAAEQAPLHEFDKTPYFEGCMPMEVMASRGLDTPRFGPMKPVGLTDPRTGERPWAVVQLRQDNLAAEHYSMVGFQTQLRWPEQKRIFRMIPGLEKAEFVRLGQVHRNCYINAPTILQPDLQTRKRSGLFFAGQISGVEGYTESAATGLLCGINAARLALGDTPLTLPRETMLGALCHYVCHTEAKGYQPTNASFGLLPELAVRGRRRERRLARANRALEALDRFVEENASAFGDVERSA
jgi:methylenetetrahydrofolate--tRNA-(uracil-5-)-methyltransferase